MSRGTDFETTVSLYDWRGHLVWTSSKNPAYKVGAPAWEYASEEFQDLSKVALSRVITLREPQQLEASSHIGKHYQVWIWPLSSPELAACMLAIEVPRELAQLTTRERECLTMLARGIPTAEIAESLGVSVSTVHTHFKRAREKLKLGSVEALIAYAARYCYPATGSLAQEQSPSAADDPEAASQAAASL